jgi:hypothetical protein
MSKWLTFGGGLAALAAALALAAGAAAAIPSAPGDPVVNGCPAGFEAIQVADFPAQYRLPARVDDPANGGNSDGIVCAKPLSAAEQAARFPNENVVIFDFRDNTLTPSH